MVLDPKRTYAVLLRLIVGLTLLGCPKAGSAAGTWSVIAPRGAALGQVFEPTALAVDAAGNLYVAEADDNDVARNRIQRRDAMGNWSLMATGGDALGQVDDAWALAVDAAGNLYVEDRGNGFQKRDAQGNWSIIDENRYGALAADTVGDLYVASDGIQKRDAQGNWSVIATRVSSPLDAVPGQVYGPNALAVDTAGNLYVAELYIDPGFQDFSRIEKRDAQGIWSVIATGGYDPGSAPREVYNPIALAVDVAGNLYVADEGYGIQKRDARGTWSNIADYGSDLGQVSLSYPLALAVDAAGNLYVADSGNNRVQQYTPDP